MLYPCTLITAAAEVLKTYSYSQGFEIGFGEFALAATLAASPVCWICTVHLEMGILGYVVYKYTIDFLNLGFSLFVFWTKLHPLSRDIKLSDF